MKASFLATSTPSGKSYRLYYKTWGEDNPRERTLVCVHGLNGNHGDFKFVGEYLSSRFKRRIVAIDIAGRGQSDYYDDADDYNFNQYLKDLDLLLEAIGCDEPSSCDWLGVSMGGLLGFYIAARDNSPIRRMVVSEVGPEVPETDIQIIYDTFSRTCNYNSFDAIFPAIKPYLSPPSSYSRGHMTEEQWRYFVETYYIPSESGGYRRNMDFKLIHRFRTEPLGAHETLWHLWEKTLQPVLALRGEYSTLFPQEIAQKMIGTKNGAAMDIETIAGCGHVPSLYPDEQIQIIADWLERTHVPSPAA